MTGRRKDRLARLTGFLALAVLVHLNLFLLGLLVVKLHPEKPLVEAIDPVDVSLVGDKELQGLAETQEELRQQLKKDEEKEKEKDKDLKGQVVDIAPPKEEKHPDKAKFLSEYDSKVERETKGPAVPYRPGKILSDRPVHPSAQHRPATPQEQEQTERKVMKLAMRGAGGGGPNVPKSELPSSETGGDEPSRNQVDRGAGPGPLGSDTPSPNKKKISMKDLQLSDAELGRAVGSRANDYLKDVEEGESTLLNTKRWRFATFFNRVKRQVAQNWHPDVVYRRRDPTGNVYGFRDRLTILRVRLTPQGRLKEVFLEKPCGVGFLDDEAMAAFKAAEPFPNPPAGLVDKETGMISFRFGFLFEISARPGFRIFRYND
jgi:TonB family protein